MIDKSDEKLYNELSHQMDDKKGEDIMAKNKHLSDLIYAKFKTESACARYMGWTKQRLNKITNGKKIPDITEINILSRTLETPIDHLVCIFLNYKSPNEQQMAKGGTSNGSTAKNKIRRPISY
ncbi:helix-turn-helix domain-containing protein [Megasphaera massiliensis]|uniref:helix-turn-helix domain-containing protein n=2 Tax=Megasphaera massiliensis TaxID=1232428 RepID=UPI00206D8AE5|nr:helix-turn-helix transcriptional regulator [uncultured Megasphaera sp.]DAL49077.1 MAG TPA_asm: SOS-response transcriptional repressor [Caudoviricetes sp.]